MPAIRYVRVGHVLVYGADTSKVEKKHGFGDRVQLEIDEQDGNPANHADWNLRLLCRTCNLALGCGWAGGTGGDMRAVCVSVCVHHAPVC